MNCAFCYGVGYQTCNQCGGSGADGCVCANGQVICNMCGGSGRTADDAPGGSSAHDVKTTKKESFTLFYFIASMFLSALLGPAGFFVCVMIWSMIGAVHLLSWITSLGSRIRKKNAPKLD